MGVGVGGESILTVRSKDTRAADGHIWFCHGVTLCLKITLFHVYLYLQ